ncbi:MAG: BolA family protein [Gammaproteobacteria bacterium]
MNANDRIERIRARLHQALHPSSMEVVDDSHKHAGHAGAADGRGHFKLRIVSRQFEGLLPIARHRIVYDALGDMMETDIHALSIQAFAPDETQANKR